MLPRYANGGFNSMSNSEKGSLYSLAGNTVGNIVEGSQDPYTLQDNGMNQGRMIGGNALKYAGQGASMGTMIGGPVGTAIGAGVGALAGGIMGAVDYNKQNKQYEEWKANKLKGITQQGMNNYSTNIMMGFKPQGNRYATFKHGGTIHINPENKGKFTATKKRTGKTTEELTHSKNPLTRKRAIFAQNAKKWKHADGGMLPRYATGGFTPEYEVEHKEVIQGNNVKLSNGGQVSNDMHLAEGYTHDEMNPTTGTTGVLGAGGDRVFSNRSTLLPETMQILKSLKIPVKPSDTHAKVALTVAKKESKFEGGVHAVNLRERNTSNQMLQRYAIVKDIIFQDQEIQKPQQQEMPKFAMGGKINKKLPKYDDGKNLITTNIKNSSGNNGTYTMSSPTQIVNPFIKTKTNRYNNWQLANLEDNTNQVAVSNNGVKLLSNIQNSNFAPISPKYTPINLNPDEVDNGNLELANQTEIARKTQPVNPNSIESKSLPSAVNIENTAEIKGGNTNNTGGDNWGTAANTLNLINNIASVNKLKAFTNPEMPVAPVMRYTSNLPYNIYENMKAGRVALKNMNRYGANPSNKYALASNVIEGNNRAVAEDNLRRGEFNNQASLVRNQVDNQGIQIRNAIQQGKIDLNNTKVTERNNAVNVWATGEMQNKFHNDQVKLGREQMQLEYMGRYGGVGGRAFRSASDEELNRMLEVSTDPATTQKVTQELEYRKTDAYKKRKEAETKTETK